MKTSLSLILSETLICLFLSTAPAWATEKNPPGDIPDDQVFVSYTSSAGGYTLKVPEGWSRSERGSDVDFIDKFDGVAVAVSSATAPPTAKDIMAGLAKPEKAVRVVSTKDIQLPAGKVLLVKYESDSEANPVTNKRVRLENEAYVFYKNGKTATLTLWAPKGADNADQWKLMSESFRW
ncbi:MAG TPA: PsbP-related protein [Chthoniobacterales bacterium]|nr:PsbP-related protein [Chthoniobacterales bacterium]